MPLGYFFVDRDVDALQRAAAVLDHAGYREVGLLEPSAPDQPMMLHVEREEQHTVDSLHARNAELAGLAAELGLQAYDGMDVGPVPGA